MPRSDAEKSDVEAISVRLPKVIVQWLDTLVKAGLYHSRSEAIRDFARDYVQTQRPTERDTN